MTLYFMQLKVIFTRQVKSVVNHTKIIKVIMVSFFTMLTAKCGQTNPDQAPTDY